MKITPIDVPDYQKVARVDDPASGLVAIVSVHDTTLGPSLGGMRLWPYATADEALTDVLRLSRGMTYKSAVAQVGLGGGKSVVIADPKDKSPALFEAMGRFVESFGGQYITAEDVNVGVGDLVHVRKHTSHVTGLSRDMGGSGNPSPYTAMGCFEGMRAAAEHVWGSGDFRGKVVALQGPGSVGIFLGRMLVNEGAQLVVCDINQDNVKTAVTELGATVVGLEEIYGVECDIFAPCALGGILNDETIPRLQCKVVAGAANNQLLDEDRHAQSLADRGILYAPDYVINAGGPINVSLELEDGGYQEERAVAKIRNIHDALATIFETAQKRGITTHQAAQEVAEAHLEAAAAAAS